MMGLNLIAWSRDINVDTDILNMFGNVTRDSQALVGGKNALKPSLRGPTLGVK